MSPKLPVHHTEHHAGLDFVTGPRDIPGGWMRNTNVFTSMEYLGQINWNGGIGFVFMPIHERWYSAEWLRAIADFVDRMNAWRDINFLEETK